jgi:hypothetical protein
MLECDTYNIWGYMGEEIYMKEENGITLIALIITIVLMLILARCSNQYND